jgi:energy-coupling factor transport system permease protein
MNDFEFQRLVTVGQYMPTDSIVHRLDPRARLVGGLVLLAAITAAPTLPGLGAALLILVALSLLARVPLGYALKGLLPPLPFILVLILLQILFGSPEQTEQTLLALGPVRVTLTDLLDGAAILLRFSGLILALTLLSATTSTTQMVRGLDRLTRPLGRLGLPTQDFVLMVQVALRFLPLLAREAERIVKSQASRGAEWGTGRRGVLRRVRQALPILVPLFLVSLQRAENLALAMEARGYQGQRERTSMVTMDFTLTDGVALIIVIGLALIIILL